MELKMHNVYTSTNYSDREQANLVCRTRPI